MEKVILPQTLSKLEKAFAGRSIIEVLKLSQNSSKLTPSQYLIWKYCGAALVAGRPLDTTMIFMAGASGAGKSSTINVLFDDPTLCATSSSKSETKDPVLLQKTLCVSKETSPVVGKLSFIDVPGTFDTNSSNEAVNLAAIRKFKDSRIELISRDKLSSLLPRKLLNISTVVFPNLVLFTVRATDNRMLGSDSFFRKSLIALKNTGNLVDTKRPNIIVVLTHTMSLPRRKERFISELSQKQSDIRGMVLEVLGIQDVDVIPVENEAEDYDLPKRGEFYVLPNGELSHFNLFQAMAKRLEKNQDLLGKLLVGWYFGSNCPEKSIKPKIIQGSAELTQSDLALAALSLQDLKIASDDVLVPVYNFQSLGFGYCPVTEDVKPVNLLEVGATAKLKQKVVEVEGTKFLIPECVNPYVQKSSRFQKLSFFEKSEYQDHMKASYGIEAGFKLVVSTSSEGRWVNNTSGSANSSLISMAQEMQVATFKLDNPKKHAKCKDFLTELYALPDTYSDDNATEFQAFFSKWGTHLVHEQAIGGSIHLNCTMKTSSLSKDKLQEIEAKISGMFKCITSFNGNYSITSEGLRAAGIANENLRIDGGDPPQLISLETLNSKQLLEWSKSISQKPTELRTGIKLYPYYNFLESGSKYNSLRRATAEYLSETLHNRIEQAFDRAAAAEKAVNDVVKTSPNPNCFPKGTMVLLCGNERVPIEALWKYPTAKINTIDVDFASFRNYMKLGSESQTSFCTYLDKKDYSMEEYFVLHCSNGKKLVVSECHMIFEYISGGFARAKQAKHFHPGNMIIYVGTGNSDFQTPHIKWVGKEMHVGAYSPLTMSGTFFADGFLVSSYANTNSFQVAQTALLPLKLWSLFVGKKELNNRQIEDTSNGTQGIHPFAKSLIKIRRTFTSIVPNHK